MRGWLGRKPLTKPSNSGKAQAYSWSIGCWNATCFQAIGSGTEDAYRGSLVFTQVAKRSRWGPPNTLQIHSNTLGRRDHSMGRTWSGRPSWSARMFFLPGMYLADRQTECRLVQRTISEAMGRKNPRYRAALMPEISDNQGVVTHQDDT